MNSYETIKRLVLGYEPAAYFIGLNWHISEEEAANIHLPPSQGVPNDLIKPAISYPKSNCGDHTDIQFPKWVFNPDHQLDREFDAMDNFVRYGGALAVYFGIDPKHCRMLPKLIKPGNIGQSVYSLACPSKTPKNRLFYKR